MFSTSFIIHSFIVFIRIRGTVHSEYRNCHVLIMLWKDRGRGRKRVIHINTTKTYHDRQLKVCALTVLAEDHEFDTPSYSLTVESCNGFNQNRVRQCFVKV